jgi:hypothetical protein
MSKIGYLVSLLLLVLAFSGCRSKPPAATPETAAAVELSPASTHSPESSPVPADTLEPSTTASSTAVPLPTATQSPQIPRFEPAECQFSPSSISNVSCGYLYVPENRGHDDSRTIRLHVAVARSYASDPEPDPLIFLSGVPWPTAREGYLLFNTYRQVQVGSGWTNCACERSTR